MFFFLLGGGGVRVLRGGCVIVKVFRFFFSIKLSNTSVLYIVIFYIFSSNEIHYLITEIISMPVLDIDTRRKGDER